MFYYGLDFHDLAPNFILNISAFIFVCEVFLRIQPHFGLWLKTFRCQAEGCGVATRPQMVKSLCFRVIPGSVMLTHTVLEQFITE